MDYFNNTDDFIVSAKQKLADGKVLTTGTDSYWWYGDDSNESVTAKVTVDGTTKNQKVLHIFMIMEKMKGVT